jgi:hypothetical protein
MFHARILRLAPEPAAQEIAKRVVSLARSTSADYRAGKDDQFYITSPVQEFTILRARVHLASACTWECSDLEYLKYG